MSESSHRMVARPMNWISASPQHRETEDVSLRLRQTAIVRHHEHTKASHDRIPNKSSRYCPGISAAVSSRELQISQPKDSDDPPCPSRKTLSKCLLIDRMMMMRKTRRYPG